MFTSFSQRIYFAIAFCATCSTAIAGSDTESGRSFFNQNCGGCHSLSADTNHYAPNLNCLDGRPAGAAPFPGYSEDMKALAATGLIWNGKALKAFLADPVGFARDRLERPEATILMQVTVPDAADQENVLVYIASRCR